MTIKETVELMLSEDYRDRFRAEYHQTKIRYEKLHQMCVKYEAGVLIFEPTCSLELLKQQKAAMGQYLYYLEMRAELEHIDLEDLATMKTCECAGEEGCGREAAPVEDDTECGLTRDLTFGEALEAVKRGGRIRRRFWPQPMFIFLMKDIEFTTKADLSRLEFKGVTVYDQLARGAYDSVFTGWVPSQEDMLAEDWVVLD